MEEHGEFQWRQEEEERGAWRGKRPSDAGRDWGQEEKGTTEDEMAGWLSPTR